MTKIREPFNTAKMLQHTEHFKVKFNQTDALGIVWHGNYIDYFEDGREAFGRHFGISYKDVQDHGFATPIIKTQSEHKKPLRYADDAYIVTTYIDSPAAKLIFKFEIYNQSNELVCTGETTQVFTDLKGNLIITMPAFFEEWKRKVGLL
ncbi:acyl-CoA thioesterase [Flavobacterium sp. xlx-214]|uniref:acyl-CoA thioesterase n=1 Tax=unclassified Flavobacterium TaxID=196869 RepID=UPI0013D1EA36|nr:MULTISPECIES: thioesterase family protein [unclassified Flavobacterium]MBA5792107.1 acyl-CoA thioesterase [Flavobacterium sp. xlx-221]QMI84354.1 acyl-CoA thioesterase [Flavobacterium sp. xlx-214]